MITGVHAIIFTPASEEVRTFFHDVLGLASVDAGGGWPIFVLPPAELAVHPDEGNRQELYLMCDDIAATVTELEANGVELSGPVTEQSWGWLTAIRLPGGAQLGLYQPRHPSPRATALS